MFTLAAVLIGSLAALHASLRRGNSLAVLVV